MRLQTFLLGLALVGICPSGNAQAVPFSEAVRCGSISADLANTLAQVAWLSHLPMVAELAQPLPRIEIAESTYIAKDLLQEIIRQAPLYQWEAEGKVIHFYNTKLKEAKFNFLNLQFPRFVTPSNLSELKLTFPTREYGLLHEAYSGGGIVITGFGDAMLEKDLLRSVTLEKVTGREILLRVASESPTFFTVIVFPNADPTKQQMERDINLNWFWQSLKEQPGPLYVQPPASTRK
ncbi:MAG TPA: hypothetical protein VIW68_06435 [Candidatus Sulfotelmatobacter sp.]